MYLPLGSSSILRLLQLPSFLSNSEHLEQLDKPRRHGCNDLNHLANLSPYHNAPAFHRVSADLPGDCTVDQVILLHRHGSRGPTGEQSYILKLVDTLDKAQDAIQADRLPPYLEFLKEGYKYDLVPENLTVIGRKELFDHGVEFALRYPTFSTDEVVSTTVPRVIDSAHFFSQGFFGREAENIKYRTTDDFKDRQVNWLVPWEACPDLSYDEAFQTALKWAERYTPAIVNRLNKLVDGVEFTFNDIQGALYACAYDLAARGESPWCNVFSSRELQGLEYQLDLFFDRYTGHISRGDAGPLVGAFYVKELIKRLTDTTENAKPLYLDFAHDITILFALSALDLNKDSEPLSPLVHRPPAHRKFRTSDQTPFAANMVWEKFTCKRSFKGPQVRLLLNGATFPLSTCKQSWKDKKYGTCSLDAFLEANEYSMGVQYHNEIWNATCGV